MNYSPFDDTRFQVRAPPPTESGYNTVAIDLYRQGIEISTNRFRFLGSQPKLWSGNLSGFSDVVTYGQNPGFIDGNALGLESKFEDLPKFNPVAYLSMGVSYPLPVVFNNGPDEEMEASIEPLSIPFKKPSNEGPNYAHSIRGSYEDGNMEGHSPKSTNPSEQFIDLRTVSDNRVFLDEGPGDFGNIVRDLYIADVGHTPVPFDDTVSFSPDADLETNNTIIKQLAHDAMKKENVSFLPYGKKSATAGFSYYGNGIGLYGTDSIAFGGWSLGS